MPSFRLPCQVWILNHLRLAFGEPRLDVTGGKPVQELQPMLCRIGGVTMFVATSEEQMRTTNPASSFCRCFP